MKNLSVVRSVPYVLALGLFGVAAPSHAMFSDAETKAFCLAETIVSLFAVLVDHSGRCSASGDVSIDGVAGTASVTTAGGAPLMLQSVLTVHPVRGAFCDVNATGTLAGASVGNYNGYLPRTPGAPVTHAWNRGRTIMKSGATVQFGGINFYDEHNIKNFWRTPNNPNIFKDDGLEVITKFGHPRAKWRQYSSYKRPDGLDGRLAIRKEQVTPALPCKINLTLDADNPGGTFDAWGGVQVAP